MTTKITGANVNTLSLGVVNGKLYQWDEATLNWIESGNGV